MGHWFMTENGGRISKPLAKAGAGVFKREKCDDKNT